MVSSLKQHLRFLKRTPLVRLYQAYHTYRWDILGRHDVPLSRRLNFIRCAYSARRGDGRCLGSPLHLTIEPTNACDQQCPICETGNGTLGRKKRNLSLDEFKFILNQFDHNLEQLFYYFMGEPFLNKQAYEMIRHAYDRGLYISTCTDGNFLDPQAVLDSGLGEINVQIGGMTQEIHRIYRVGGFLDRALGAVEEMLRLRQLRGARNPKMKIVLGFILMGHNEHQVDEFRRYAERIGVDSYNVIGTCLRTVKDWPRYMPKDKNYWIYSEEEYRKGRLVPKTRPDNFCGWIYTSTSIHVNGDVVPCCRDPKGLYPLGNVFERPFREIWNGKAYQDLRREVSTRSNSMALCSLCPGEYLAPIGLGRGLGGSACSCH